VSRATALTVIVLAGCVPAVAAAPAWQRPVDVAPFAYGADSALVAMNVAGDSVVVWVEEEGRVMAAVRRAGGPFSGPIRLSRGSADVTANYPSVAIDGAGNAIAAWQVDAEYGDAPAAVQASVVTPDATASKPITLSSRDDAFGAAVAISDAGDAVVAWVAETKSGDVVQAAARPRGGPFAKRVSLSRRVRDVLFLDVAMNGAGDAIVAWPAATEGAHVIQAVRRPAGAGFTAPVDLSAAGGDALNPQVAIDPAGNAVATWNRSNGSHLVVQATTLSARGPFSVPVGLSAPSRDGLQAEPVVDGAGNALVVWVHEELLKDVTNGVVQASARPAGGGFSLPVNLSSAGYGAAYPSVVMNASGAALAVWSRAANDDLVSIVGVRAALRLPGGSFAAPVDIAPTRGRVSVPQPAIDRAGRAMVVWTSYNGTEGGTVRAAAYQDAPIPPAPAPPRISGLRLRPSAFRAARSGPPSQELPATGPGRVTYALSAAARVRFTVEQATAGRRAGGRCVARTRASRSRLRCTRYVRVAGRFARLRPAGADAFAFTGRLADRRLGAGRYRLVAVATAAARSGKPAQASFRIVR
jgi:hypothetical protein